MSYFNLEDRYQDDEIIGHAISRFEGIVLAVLAHGLLVLLMLFGPRLPIFQVSPEELQRRQQELEQLERQRENQTMVFVQPRVDLKAAQPPPRAELSDADRKALTPQLAPDPINPLPYMRGNSPERNENAEAERAKGAEAPEPPQPEREEARIVPPVDTGLPRPPERPRTEVRGGGALGEALRNLERYVQKETFNNPQGGKTDPGATIQFDTKGVEFGPWLRRFVSRVRRNWFIPLAAQTMRGHVVLQFNIHKDGHITDISVLQPSALDSFNTAALNAIITSNPVDPLPPEYPSDVAAFTVTFYYNEDPPGQ